MFYIIVKLANNTTFNYLNILIFNKYGGNGNIVNIG